MRKKTSKARMMELKGDILRLYQSMRSTSLVGKALGISGAAVLNTLRREGVQIEPARNNKTLTRKDWFLRNVMRPPAPACWQWTATFTDEGYGNFWNGERMVGAHRWAYENFKGPIPPGTELDHLCRNRWCVNPEHLEPVSHKEDMHRGDMLWKSPDWSPICKRCQKKGTDHSGLCTACRIQPSEESGS